MLQHEQQTDTEVRPTLKPPTQQTEATTIEHAYGTVWVPSGDSEAYVTPLLANLRKIKLLRHVTVEQLRAEAAEPEIFGLLRMCLTENSELHWKSKIVAAWALSRATLDESQRNRTVAQLYDIIGKYGESGSASWVSRIWNAGARVMKWVLPLVAMGAVFAFISVPFFSSELMPPPIIGIFSALFGLGAFIGAVLTPFIVPYSLMVDADHFHEVRAAAVRALRALGGVESLDSVAKMALESSPMTSGPARGTLVELLRKLTPEHYGTLPSSLVPDLCRILRYEAAWLSAATENHTLALRVVEGLEKIGDGHAASVVEKLLKGSMTPQLRAAMQAALPILQERRNRENAREMLLRHSAMPPASPQELLRPAVETVSQIDPATLVRAADVPAEMDAAP